MVKYVGNAYAEDVGIEAFGYVHIGGWFPPVAPPCPHAHNAGCPVVFG